MKKLTNEEKLKHANTNLEFALAEMERYFDQGMNGFVSLPDLKQAVTDAELEVERLQGLLEFDDKRRNDAIDNLLFDLEGGEADHLVRSILDGEDDDWIDCRIDF